MAWQHPRRFWYHPIRIVYTSYTGIGHRPFFEPVALRPAWQPLFNSETCYRDLASVVQFRPWPSRVSDELEDPIANEIPAYSEWSPSKPFIRNLGRICLKTEQLFVLAPHQRSYARDEILQTILGKDQEQSWDDDDYPQRYSFGYDRELPDQRFNYLPFDLARAVYLRAETTDDIRCSGRLKVQLFPSGYIKVQVSLLLFIENKSKGADGWLSILHRCSPYREAANGIIWKSSLGNGTLPEIIKRVRSVVRQSIFMDQRQKPYWSDWSMTLILQNTDWNFAHSLLDPAQTKLAQMSVADDHGNNKHVFACSRGVGAVLGQNSPQWTKRLVALSDFVALKRKVYADIGRALQDELVNLKATRLSTKEKLSREIVTRLTVYDPKIPMFLSALDSFIQDQRPFNRRLYSMISTGTGFDDLRLQTNQIVRQWEDEAEKWDPGNYWRRWLSEDERQNVTKFFVKELHMGDNYSAGQAGAMGPGAQATNMRFQQIWNQTQSSVDLQQLARELERLNDALRAEAKEPEHQMAIGAISAAEAEAKRGNGPKALEYLKKAGTWALDVATKIGVDVATGAMKSLLGMP